jgi:hypothetical protein
MGAPLTSCLRVLIRSGLRRNEWTRTATGELGAVATEMSWFADPLKLISTEPAEELPGAGSVIKSCKQHWGKIGTTGVPSATLGTGSQDHDFVEGLKGESWATPLGSGD